MKILLVQPPVRDFYRTAIRTQPIGLAYLAASLVAHGHGVEILDCQTDKKRAIPIPSELDYLQAYYPGEDRSPFKLYAGYYHFGMDWDEIRKRIEGSQADVFGISSSFTPYHNEALEIAMIIKQGDCRRIVVMGGAHVSCDPQGVLESPLVDYCVLGEGEIRFPKLLEQLERGGVKGKEEIDGIGYCVDGKISISPMKTFVQELDLLPYPARGLLDPDRYCMRKKRTTMIMTSRGCPHGCAYCSAHLVMGSSFRARSPEGIVQEMIECQRLYGINIFDIEDDNFTLNKERAKRLLRLIIETFGEGHLQLSAMNGISFASLDSGLLRLMKGAGFKTINLSFVSVDPFIQEHMHRPGGMSGFGAIATEAERAGLNVVAYAILGMPGQTIEDMVDTLIYLMSRRVLIGPSIYYPTPGTALFERCKTERMLPAAVSQWRSSAFPIETKDFDRLDIVTLFRLARVINFIKGQMDKDELDEGITWRELKRTLHKQGIAGDKGTCHATCNRDNFPTWCDLIVLFMNERSFFSLPKDQSGTISLGRLASSNKVLDYFFAHAWDRPIYKSRAV